MTATLTAPDATTTAAKTAKVRELRPGAKHPGGDPTRPAAEIPANSGADAPELVDLAAIAPGLPAVSGALDDLEREVAEMEREAALAERLRAVRERLFPTLLSKVAYIQVRAGEAGLKKSASNEGGGWKYAPISAFYELLGPLWKKTNVVVTFHRTARKSEDVRDGGRIGQRTTIDLFMRVEDADRPGEPAWEVPATGESVDYFGKDLNQALTFGIRNVLISGYRIYSGDEPDALSNPQGETLVRATPHEESSEDADERRKLVPEMMQLVESARLDMKAVREATRTRAGDPAATSQTAPLPALRAVRDWLKMLSDIERAAVRAEMAPEEVDDLLRITANDNAAQRASASDEMLARLLAMLNQMAPEADSSAETPASESDGKYGTARDMR